MELVDIGDLKPPAKLFGVPVQVRPRALGLFFFPVEEVGVYEEKERAGQYGHEDEPHRMFGEDDSQKRNGRGCLEKRSPEGACFVPYGFAGQGPGGPDPDGPVGFGFPDELPGGIENEGDAGGDKAVDVESPSQVPSHDENVQIEEEDEEGHDERVEFLFELFDVFPLGIYLGKDEEQDPHARHNEREEDDAPEAAHVSVGIPLYVPVGRHLLGQEGIRVYAERYGKDENDCDDDIMILHGFLF